MIEHEESACSSHGEHYGLERAMAHGPDDESLKKGLKQRHLTMIAIGGVIGAGLFVGSGAIMVRSGRRRF